MKPCIQLLAVCLCASAPVLASSLAHAQSATQHDPHSSDHPHNIVGAKFVGVALVDQNRADEVGVGLSLFYERSLIQGWLEIEWAGAALQTEHQTLIPIDLVIKSPLGCNHMLFEPYVGAGPALDLVLESGEQHLYPGLVAVAGTYMWLTETFGVDVEAAYSLTFEDHLVQGIFPALGAVAHF